MRAALKIVDSVISSSLIRPLFKAVIESWNIDRRTGALLFASLKLQILAYGGRSKAFKELRDDLSYFEPKRGCQVWTDDILKSGREIAAEINEKSYLGEGEQKYPYFQDLVIRYSRSLVRTPSWSQHIDGLLSFLTSIKSRDTNLISISHLIVAMGVDTEPDDRQVIQSYAFEEIGDPDIAHHWRLGNGGSEAEQSIVDGARDVLNGWLAQQFISLFFQGLADMDRDRKDFWLHYICARQELQDLHNSLSYSTATARSAHQPLC